MKTYQAGIDVGSTTVKLVVLDENGQMIFGQYQRHLSHTQRALSDLLKQARAALGECALELRATGSGAINLAKALGIPFVQEVVAVAQALERVAPQVDVAIELGGEDAKIIYFKGGLEERMNGVCAGGTGSFIDQMAASPRRISSPSSTRVRRRPTLPPRSSKRSSTRPFRALPAASPSAAMSRS